MGAGDGSNHSGRDGADSPWDFSFSTAGMRPGEKFEAWRDISRRLIGIEASADDPESFEGEFVGRTAGAVRLYGPRPDRAVMSGREASPVPARKSASRSRGAILIL